MSKFYKVFGVLASGISGYTLFVMLFKLNKAFDKFLNTSDVGNWKRLLRAEVEVYFWNSLGSLVVFTFCLLMIIKLFRNNIYKSEEINNTKKEIELIKLQKELEQLKSK